MNKDRLNNIEGKSPNEIDPRLRFDAFMGGVKDGGLRSVSSISMLVCYIVASISGKVTADNIINTMDEGMFANHFEIADAIDKLKKSGTIIEAEDGALSINESNKASIDLIEKDLPLTIRERSVNLCQKIIAREAYKRENKIEVEEVKNGYTITLKISDADTDYMKLKLFATSKAQVDVIKEKFVDKPIEVYNTLIDSIFSNK